MSIGLECPVVPVVSEIGGWDLQPIYELSG